MACSMKIAIVAFGDTQINTMHVGSKEIVVAYLGNTKIFEKA